MPEAGCRRSPIRAAGHHPFIYRKMVIGPAGTGVPNHGDLVRVVDRDEQAPRLWALEPPFPDQPPAALARPEPPGPEFWDRKIARAAELRTDVLGLGPADQRLPRRSMPRGTDSPA